MRPRFLLIKLLTGLGFFSNFLNASVWTLVLVLSKPRDLEELVKRAYTRHRSLRMWGGEGQTRGLTFHESQFVAKFLKGKKRYLVFQSGGGRESFALAKAGYEVTGIDSAPALVEKAKDYASKYSLPCNFVVQDMFDGLPSAEKYDALFLTKSMYSAIPTRGKRVAFLNQARTFLSDSGFFYLEFWGGGAFITKKESLKFRLKKGIALLCSGNTELEEGDTYRPEGHFMHVFGQESELLDEMKESDFEVVENHSDSGYVILTPKKVDEKKREG